jgi:threonine/homoserine/homoserine lactone efflux protein
MIEFSQLYFFLGASLALLLVPGPAVLYITARSANQGRLAGLVSVLAIETANFLQAVAATLGLSAILLSSALAFDVVKYLGAAYLIYLGGRKLLAREEEMANGEVKEESLARITGRDSPSTCSTRRPRCSTSLFCLNLWIRRKETSPRRRCSWARSL